MYCWSYPWRPCKQLVGGPVQTVYSFEAPEALICHEEGKLMGCLRL